MVQELAAQAQRRLTVAMLMSNTAGALVVFAFAMAVLPVPPHYHHVTRSLLINVSAFVVFGIVSLVVGWKWSRSKWDTRFAWAIEGRKPTAREQRLALLFPIAQQVVNARIWIGAAVVFTALNAPFSGEAAGDAAITAVLGGLVTCAAGYLLCERIARPLTAASLATGVPASPVLPGVRTRALLSWTLGTGVILLGVALVGVGGLYESSYTRTRLAVAMLVLAVIGLTVGLATTIGLARSLADPIESLRRAFARVEEGVLDEEVPVDDGSEVGLLQAGFNQMVGGLRERERLRDLFGRQVGEDVVRHALEHGVQLGGEAREAAVLFVDLQGSTTLAETRDPAEVVKLLNAFFAIVVEVVGANDGWVNKFEGDAALCIFGAPLEDPDAASHALAAARTLRDRLATELDGLAAGIGVSAGRVVAGNIGAAKRFEYTVIGDPVNEAARLTELAKHRPGRLLVSHAALARARDGELAYWELCDELTLRGRSAPTSVAVTR